MALGYLACGRDKRLKGPEALLDIVMRQEIGEYQSQEEHCQNNVCQHISIVIDNLLGDNNHHRPVSIFHIGIEHPAVEAGIRQPADTALTVHHLPRQFIVGHIFIHGYRLLEILLQHLALIRMDEVSAVAVDNEAVRLLFEAFLITGMNHGIFLLMAQTEPLQRHIGTQHTDLAALMVADMGEVSGRKLLRGCPVEIRGCPLILGLVESVLIPGMHQEIGMILIHLLTLDHAVRIAPGVDLETVAFMGVEVWLEDQSAARHILIQGNHALQMRLQLIRIVDITLNEGHVINGGHIHIRQHATDLLVFIENDTLIARLSLLDHRIPGNRIDDGHDDDCHHHYHQHNP